MDTNDPTCTTPRLTYTCPHCSGVLDLTPLIPTPSAAAASTAPAGRVPDALDRWKPIVRALRQVATSRCPLPVLPHRLRWALSALLLLFLLGVLVWQQWVAPAVPAVAPPAAAVNTTSATSPDRSAASVLTADQIAVLAVAAAYNAAEAEVGQTLSLTPILPLLAPEGPLAQRRAEEIAQRRQTHAAHATHLLRWAVGTIEVDATGTLASVTTQETWQDQVGSNRARTATVRVVYSLRRADPHSAWQIVDAQSTLL